MKNFVDIDFNSIISYLTSPELQERLFPVKVAFWVFSGFFLVMIIFVFLRTHYLQWLFFQDFIQFFTMRPFGAKRITRQWNKILRRSETGVEAEYKLAVIEADGMLDSALKRMGYTGTTLEEKLGKLTSATISNIEELHEAHQLRNNIVRDPDYRLPLDEAKKTLDIYERAFRDLHILEK